MARRRLRSVKCEGVGDICLEEKEEEKRKRKNKENMTSCCLKQVDMETNVSMSAGMSRSNVAL